MTLALLVLTAGLCAAGLIILARVLEYRAWRRELIAFSLQLPANLNTDDATAWLSVVAAALHTPNRALVWHPPLVLEIVATKQGITHYLLVSWRERGMLLTSVAAALPGARLEVAPEYLNETNTCSLAAELTMTSHGRLLAIDRGKSASTALLASIQPLHGRERVVLSWLITGAGTPSPIRTRDTDGSSWLPWWLEADAPADADDVRALRLKQREPLLYLAGRIGVAAAHPDRAASLLGRVVASLRVLNAPGVQLVRRWWPSHLASARLARRLIPLARYPMTMNAAEAAAAIGLPIGESFVPGLALGASRTLPPPSSMDRHGVLVGDPTYPGVTRPLMLGAQDRLRHSWLIGPTGTGKSTLIANMALQDITAGYGVTVIDPKADLIDSILARLPEEHRKRVVVLDAAAINQSVVGFSLLAAGADEQSRELAVDNTAHILRSLYADSWGPRSDQYLRAGLMALVHARAPDGSAFTLVDLPVLLEQARFRRYVLAQPTVPERVRQAWTAFESASDAEKSTIVAPLLHKLGALTLRSALRLSLGQSIGVRFDDLFKERRSLLVSLRKDAIGQDSAQLLGALLVASLWQATLRRAAVSVERRRPYFVYLDEFQDVVRLPLDLADMLAQSRSLGVGLHLAHQYLDQLPKSVQTAVLGTTRTQVAFQLNHADGRTLAPLFAPLTPADLTGLPAYEIALRPCVNGTTASVVTGKTRPLPELVADPATVAEASRARYGMARAEVEAAMQTRTTPPERESTIGRQRRGARS